MTLSEAQRACIARASVDYHAIIGDEVTSSGHTIEAIDKLPSGVRVAWISGKSGCVALEALTLTPQEIVNEQN